MPSSKFSAKDLDAFVGPVRPKVFGAGTNLYRFSEHPDGVGPWWITYETFRILYDEAGDRTRDGMTTSGTEFRRLYRQYLAISIDWNLMVDFFRLEIPEGRSAAGWIGQTRGQPFVSAKAQADHGVEAQGRLPGGLEQVYLEVYDQGWVRRISL